MSEKNAKGYQAYFDKIKEGDLSINPYLKLFNIKVDSVEEGRAVLSMHTNSTMHQGGGIIQGGIIAALSDEAMAHALLADLKKDEITATVDIHHSHLRPVKDGIISARGEIVKRGRRIAFLKAEVSHNGKVVLTSTATFIIQKNS